MRPSRSVAMVGAVAVIAACFPPAALSQTEPPVPASIIDFSPLSLVTPSVVSASVAPALAHHAAAAVPAAGLTRPPAGPVSSAVAAAAAPARSSEDMAQAPTAVEAGPLHPVRIRIPAIGLDATIVGVGVTSSGAMAVPSGSSRQVGWYQGGVVPGQTGSAVLDAHVFAAFSKLKYARPGDAIYVAMSDGSTLHFLVTAAETFALASLSSSQLFRSSGTADLNLITCAGSLTADRSTYDHRLIVYSTLVRE